MTTVDAGGLCPVRAALVAVGSVVAAATLGQFLAGADPRARLTELDTTRLTLPFAAWIVVAIIYYVIAGVVVYRLGRRLPEARPAFVAVLCLILTNEAWNALLFGFDSVTPAAIGMVFFAAITTITSVLVLRADRVAAWVLLPYVVWVVAYDVPWIFAVWRNSVL
jgi:tryptophan-rich sensory protein